MSLHGSRSFKGQMGGMSLERSEEMRAAGNLFQEPDSMLLVTSGMGRHWPDGRGIFHNKSQDFFVWVNEEDHLRVISMELGDNIQAVITRLINGLDNVNKVFKANGYDFAWNEHLGF